MSIVSTTAKCQVTRGLARHFRSYQDIFPGRMFSELKSNFKRSAGMLFRASCHVSFIFFSLDLSRNITAVTESQHSSDYGLTLFDNQHTFIFFGSTDEIQKASAYMTETYFLSSSKQTRDGQEPTRAPFCFAFDTVKSGTGGPYYWLFWLV